jgi:hypothetical protein
VTQSFQRLDHGSISPSAPDSGLYVPLPCATGWSRQITFRESDRVQVAGLKAITLGKLRHSNISRMRAAGVAAC